MCRMLTLGGAVSNTKINSVCANIAGVFVYMTAFGAFADAAPIYNARSTEVYNWTGFYIGANAGHGWGHADSSVVYFGNALTLPTGFAMSDLAKPNGFIGGAQIGYNWQVSRDWVFGLEADWQGSGQKAASSRPSQSYILPGVGAPIAAGTYQMTYDAKIDWFGTARARIGYAAWNRILLYATGGLGYAEVKVSGTATDSGNSAFGPYNTTAAFGGSKVNAGWTVGGGIEAALAGNWTWKVEYLYLDLGTLDLTAPGPSIFVGGNHHHAYPFHR